jgi:hypothetical protein
MASADKEVTIPPQQENGHVVSLAATEGAHSSDDEKKEKTPNDAPPIDDPKAAANDARRDEEGADKALLSVGNMDDRYRQDGQLGLPPGPVLGAIKNDGVEKVSTKCASCQLDDRLQHDLTSPKTMNGKHIPHMPTSLVEDNHPILSLVTDLSPLTDLFINELQPLPSINSTSFTSNAPGAYPIAGIPPMHMLGGMHQRRAAPSMVARAEHSPVEEVIGEAVLVGTDEEYALPPYDVTTGARHDEGLDRIPDFGLPMEEVIDGKIMSDAPQERAFSRKTWFWMIAAFFVVLCVLVISLVVGGSHSRKESTNTQGQDICCNTTAQLQGVNPPFRDDIPVGIKKLTQDPHHPHFFANNWILQDPYFDTYSPERQLQRFHMASFYNVTHGDGWFRNDHWLSYEVHECDWFSQSNNPTIAQYDYLYDICDDDGRLLKLNLASNNLQGTFPLVTSFIDTLRTYDISDNGIRGAVATGSSPDLEVFIISNNGFEGLLVGDGGFSAFDVRVVKLDGNKLSGSHAPLYYILRKLELVNITNNLFSGQLPTEVAYCSNLTYFGYGHNNFEGTMPTQLAALPALEAIDVSGNPRLNGTIPNELTELSLLRLLDVSSTAITGDVPALLCDAVREERLQVKVNCTNVDCCQ